MAAVAPLWLVGTSQPKSCDALFATWIERGHVNNRLVWERLTLAIQARSWDLARYLAGLLSVELRKQGELFYRVGRDPSLVTGHGAIHDRRHGNARDRSARCSTPRVERSRRGRSRVGRRIARR